MILSAGSQLPEGWIATLCPPQNSNSISSPTFTSRASYGSWGHAVHQTLKRSADEATKQEKKTLHQKFIFQNDCSFLKFLCDSTRLLLWMRPCPALSFWLAHRLPQTKDCKRHARCHGSINALFDKCEEANSFGSYFCVPSWEPGQSRLRRPRPETVDQGIAPHAAGGSVLVPFMPRRWLVIFSPLAHDVGMIPLLQLDSEISHKSRLKNEP